MFTSTIRSKVKKAINAKIASAEKKFKDGMKIVNDACDQAKREAEIKRDREETTMADKLVKEIIG